MDAGRGGPLPRVASRLNAAQLEFETQTQRFKDARARWQVTFDQFRDGRPRRDMLRASAFARLQARLDTMPVIEQAKGVLMAQQRCGPEEAFDLLRREIIPESIHGQRPDTRRAARAGPGQPDISGPAGR